MVPVVSEIFQYHDFLKYYLIDCNTLFFYDFLFIFKIELFSSYPTDGSCGFCVSIMRSICLRCLMC